MDEPLDDLLERLGRGDKTAAEALFRAYEPYLRVVVRRQLPARLRSRFDSVDIVQSVWADVLEGFQRNGCRFIDANYLRAFLVTAARNRFIDRYRQHHRAVALEQPLAGPGEESVLPSPQPRPSEIVRADDLWQRLLALSPPHHHALLHLKRDGLSVSEIAARTGLHPDSIHRILRQLARQLANQENED